MKKLIAISVVFVFVAGVAFAQTADGISVNAWGRGAFAPLVVVGPAKVAGETPEGAESLLYSGASTSWGWNGNEIRTDFRINGNADFVGFQVQLGDAGDGSHGVKIIDNAYIWAKPFSNDFLKLSVGHFYVDELRGKVDSDTGFENFVLNPMDGCKIFTRFQASQGDGIYVNGNGGGSKPNGWMLSSAPVDGLFFGFLVNGALFTDGSLGGKDATKAGDAFRFMHIGVGYNIADIGHVRAQWIGGWFGSKIGDEDVGKAMDKGKYDIGPAAGKTARIEAAFALTMVQNLLIDLGGKFWLPLSDKDGEAKDSNGVEIALGAKFRAEAFQIIAHIDTTLAGYSHANKDDKSANGLGLAVNLLPSYDLDAFTVGASLGMTLSAPGKGGDGKVPEGAKATTQFGFGAYAQKALGSGNVRAGLAYTLPPSTDGKATGSGVFSIPVILEYAFF